MSATVSPAAAESANSQQENRVEASARLPLLRRAAVLGAGTMGSRIAAHLANAGVPVVLLDIVPGDAGGSQDSRSALAVRAIDALLKSKPAAFYDSSAARLITPGNLEDDLRLLGGCGWVIEAVSENLAIKQALLAKIAPHLRPEAIVTTNTSGLPVASIAAEMPAKFRRRWFGTHFFNPPRYMRLLEIRPRRGCCHGRDELSDGGAAAGAGCRGRSCNVRPHRGAERGPHDPSDLAQGRDRGRRARPARGPGACRASQNYAGSVIRDGS